MSKIVFKTYNQQQPMLLPPNLDDLIEGNHPVRIVNSVIDSIDIDEIVGQYKGGGTSSFHPRMPLKVLVFASSALLFFVLFTSSTFIG